ncbi:MAG: TonB-dependent receptor, partial [Bacteroidota bacterium]
MSLGKKIILYIIFLVFTINLTFGLEPLASDNSSLGGVVMSMETSETLIGASVFIKGTKLGSYTNKNGFFSIKNIPPGERTVIISFLGYEKLETKINFKIKESIQKKFYLKTSSIKTNGVSVEAEREIEKREITISKVNIPVEQLKEIRIGGEADVFRSLQFLPGILTSSQISSGLFVRGGSPDQNLVLVDGTVVYNPTHLFGFISTFNSDAIKDVELIKGGFPAEYGGRLSAVLNMTQKDGNRNEIHGLASIGALSSRLSLEGPIGDGSWFIGGRRTYLEVVKLFIPNDPEAPLPDFNFYDLNAKITQNFGESDKVSLSGFMSADALEMGGYGMTMDLDIGNRLGALKWTHIFGTDLFSSLILSGSHYLNTFAGDQSGYKFLIDNTITDYTLKGSLEWFTSEDLTQKFGFEVTNYTFGYLQNFTGNTDSTQQGSSGGSTNLTIQDWNYSIFGQVNYTLIELLSLQMGARVAYWDLSKQWMFDPRIAVRYQFQSNVAIKAAFGIYHQNLKLATQPDFSFFDTWLPTDNSIPASRSLHYILSVETNPFDGYTLDFDLYYKKMYNVTELNTTALKGEVVADMFYVGNADAYGFEVFIQKRAGRLTGWLG